MTQPKGGKRTGRTRGWLIAGLSVALLVGLAALKGRADASEEGLDLN